MFCFVPLWCPLFLGVCLVAGKIGGKSAIAIGNTMFSFWDFFFSPFFFFLFPGGCLAAEKIGGKEYNYNGRYPCFCFALSCCLFVGGCLVEKIGEIKRKFLFSLFFFVPFFFLDLGGNERTGLTLLKYCTFFLLDICLLAEKIATKITRRVWNLHFCRFFGLGRR